MICENFDLLSLSVPQILGILLAFSDFPTYNEIVFLPKFPSFLDGKLSSKLTLISGVPQGSVLGPVLFLIVIFDISEGIDSDIFIYVNDTKLVQNIKSVEDVFNLQEDRDQINRWSVKNKMVYTGGKFVNIRYGKDKHIKESTTYFSGDMAEVIKEMEDIGDLQGGSFFCPPPLICLIPRPIINFWT